MSHDSTSPRGLGPGVWIAVLSITAARLALALSGAFNLSPDEAYFWEWARHPAFGYYDQGPLVAWIILFFTRIFGDTELGVRAGAILLSGITALLLGGLTRRLGGGRRAALLAVLAYSLTPLGEVNGFIMTYYVPQLLLWALILHGLLDLLPARESGGHSPPYGGAEESGGNSPPYGPWLRLGVWLGLGGLTHHTFLYLGLIALAWTLWIPRVRRAYRTPWPYVAALAALVIASPYFYWNSTHDWVLVKHALGLVATGHDPWRGLGWYVTGQFGVLTPLYLALALVAAGAAFRPAFAESDPTAAARARLILLGTWPLFFYVAALAWSGRSEANWTSAATATLACAFGIRLERERGARAALGFAALALAVSCTVALHDASLLWRSGLRFADPSQDPTHRLHGWRELGRAAYSARESLAVEGPVVTATVDDYAIPAELSFYAPDNAETYCPPVSRRHHQYDFWKPHEPPVGGNAVWVTRDPIREDAAERALFREWRPAQVLEIVDPPSGVVRRRFYLYLCKGFTGPPKPSVSGY